MQRVQHAILLAAWVASLFMGVSAVFASPLLQGSSLVRLRVAMPAPENLDPVHISRFDSHTRDLVENLFVGLTRYNPQTQQIEPMLARDWTVSDDGLLWTFNLREDIQWVRMDPNTQEVVAVRPVAAGDVVYAIQRACDPLRPSPVTTNLMIIRGCQTVANAPHEVIDDLFIAREIGVRAIGPSTLEIDLMFPASYFLTLASMPEFRPLPREAVSDTANWTVPAAIITNGPYVLKNWTGTGMELIRNPLWPDAFTGNIEAVEVTFTSDTTTAPALIGGGQVDMARLSPTDIAAAQTTSSDLLHIAPGAPLVLMGFSYDRLMVNVPEVRRALALAIDRDALSQQLLPGRAAAISQFTPPGMIASPEAGLSLFNPSQAQSDYGKAGYPGCDAVTEKLIILVPEEDLFWTEVAQAVIQQWSANLGCNPALFEVRTLPRTLMIELSHATYDPEQVTRSHIWLAFWSADYPDANAWIGDALHCRYGYIRTGRECEEGDALLDQAAVEPDATRRAELYAQVEQWFFGPNGTFPVIPLYISTSAWLQQPWLSDVNEFGPARYDLWTVDSAAQGNS